MNSPTEATELVAFEQLDAAITGATVFQDVPENEPPPLVIIGDMESSPFGRSDDPDRRIVLTLVVITEGDERRPCSDLQGQIETTLSGKSFRTDGWILHFALESSDAALADDGSGYVGTTILTVLAFSET